MAKFKCIGSSSKGNCYLIECKDETIILELGVHWKNIIEGLNYNINKVKGCLCSHKHFDHSIAVPNALKLGLNVYSCQDMQTIYKDVKVLKKGLKTQIGGFKVQPIPLKHSVECYGFIIEHSEFGKLLFFTDCCEFKYKVKGVNHILAEANHSEELIIDNIINDESSRSLSENHMKIDDTIEAIKANYNKKLVNIVLIHLSSGNANPKEFVKQVKDEIGLNNVFVAKKGFNLELSKEEF